MSEFNEILAKHFAGESSPEEEAQVKAWKSENIEEYKMLADVWQSTPDLRTHSYNKLKAWQKIDAQTSKSPQKIFRLGMVGKIAAAAAVVLLIGFALVQYFGGPEMVKVENESASIKEVALPDGSTVSLAQNASIKYPSDFEENRTLDLRGQAYFEVSKDEEHPFKVHTSNGEIEVLGTAFNVNAIESSTEVAVTHGIVALRNEGREIKLFENEAAQSTKIGVFEKIELSENYLSWKTGVFNFTETPLSEVVQQLNEYYTQQMIIGSERAKEVELTASFDNNTFEEVLTIIIATTNLNSIETEEGVILK